MGKYNMDNVKTCASYYVDDTETTTRSTLGFIEFVEQMNVRRAYHVGIEIINLTILCFVEPISATRINATYGNVMF